MTEQIEKIRADFESEIHKVIPALNLIWDNKTGQYYPFDTQIAWLSWQAARRAQNPIAIPPVWNDEYGHLHVSLQNLTIALNISGYPYTLPGE